MDINKMMQEMMMSAMRSSAGSDSSGGNRRRGMGRGAIFLVLAFLVSIFFNIRQSKQLKEARQSANTMETKTTHPYNHCLKIVMKNLTSEQLMKEKPDSVMQVCESLKPKEAKK